MNNYDLIRGTLAHEFPDYDPTWLPEIPDHWKSTHWHNDTCPSWEVSEGFRVFIDYPAEHAHLREDQDPDMPRFFLVGEDGNAFWEGNQWPALLDAVMRETS